MNEKFYTLRLTNNMILLHSKNLSVKDLKKIYKIDIWRDIISLNVGKYANNIEENNTICIDVERIILKASQTSSFCNSQKNRCININM